MSRRVRLLPYHCSLRSAATRTPSRHCSKLAVVPSTVMGPSTSTAGSTRTSPTLSQARCGNTVHQPELKISRESLKEVTRMPMAGTAHSRQMAIRMAFPSRPARPRFSIPPLI